MFIGLVILLGVLHTPLEHVRPLCVCSSPGYHTCALTHILLKHGLWDYEDAYGSLDYYDELKIQVST